MSAFGELARLPRSIWLVAAATLINRAGTMVQPFLVLYLTKSLGLPAEQAGWMISVWGLASLVSAPLSGALCDRWGARRVAVASLVGSALLMFAYPQAHTIGWLVAATVALAFVGDAFRPASMVLFGELAPPDKGKQAFALQRLAVNLGMAVGPAAGGLLASRWYAALFYVDGVTSLLAAVVLAWWMVRRPATTPGSEQPRSADGMRRAHRDRALLYFLAASLLGGIVFFQLDAALPLYLVRYLGLDERQFGTLMVINPVMIIFLEVPLNAATARWSPRAALSLGALLVTAGFAATGLASGWWTMAATVVVWTFGEMILFPASAAYVSELAPAERRGEYMGLFTMSFGVAHAFAPAAGTITLERLGGPSLWLAVLGVGLLSVLLFARVRPAETLSMDRT